MLNEVILYSSSTQFLTLTEKYLKNNGINISSKFTEFTKLKKMPDTQKNKLFIIKLKKDDYENSIKIIDFLIKNKIKWICISCDEYINISKKSALEYLYISETPNSEEFKTFLNSLCYKINTYFKNFINLSYKNIITIGASTGGTDAVEKVLQNLPKNTPPILVVIHMPAGFTNLYAKRLNEICEIKVKEAKNGDELKSGLALIAPGGFQMKLQKANNKYYVSCTKEGKYNGHEPSVNVLFNSIPNNLAPNVISVILTGMGNDGAEGILKIKKNGGYTIGQNEASCVVYGMPKVAYDIGAISVQADINDISNIIKKHIFKSNI